MKTALSKLPRAEQWADRIRIEMSKTVESIIEVGRLLVKAKAGLPHGEWGRLFEDELVPFSINTAQRLMAIANHPVLSNTAHVQLLPASWGTLYELTKLPQKALDNAFRDGLITPEMERSQVKKLLPPPPSTAQPVEEEVVESDVVQDCDIPDSDIIGSFHTCPTCGQRWPEGKAIHG